MSDTPRTDAAWLKRADSPRRQCSEQLERELSAYQAEMPEAPKVWTPSLMEDHWHETNWVEATDYDALAKRCARLTVALSKKPCSALEGDEVGNPCSYYRDLTVAFEAARKDAERHKFAMRHVSYYSMQSRFLIDCEHESMPGSDTSMDYENSIDIALAAGKEKAE